MKNSELFKLACHCLILDEIRDLQNAVKEKFVSGEVDKEQFIKLCSDHLVLPLVTRKLQNAGILKLFPREFSEHLLEISELNRQRNLEILQQIDEINAALIPANIQYNPFI